MKNSKIPVILSMHQTDIMSGNEVYGKENINCNNELKHFSVLGLIY